jgi:putative restriction endonuclease
VSDAKARHAAFDWLAVQVDAHGDVLPWKLLARGFVLDGVRVPLVSQQGIFKPAVMELPLFIRTSAGGPTTMRSGPMDCCSTLTAGRTLTIERIVVCGSS